MKTLTFNDIFKLVLKNYNKCTCHNCMYNDKKYAEKNFYSNYCTLWECQQTDKKRCKYKKINK